MIIVGTTACGKTHYLLRQLKTSYNQKFENTFLICPTYTWNKTYDQDFIHNDPNFSVIPCKQDDVEEYLKFILDFIKGIGISPSGQLRESLIILDLTALAPPE
jgi:hypothetical protein